MHRYICLVLALLCASAFAAPPPARDDVVPALKAGGYVLFLRHTESDPNAADTNPLDLDDTAHQRPLTDAGRAQARAIGAALKRLGIPVGRIIAGKFQRTAEAARLLDLGAVELSLDVTEGGLVVTPNENKRRAAALMALLASAPAQGTNTLIVSHRPNLQDAAGKAFGDVAEGEMVIFRPLGDGTFEPVARVAPPSIWTEWAR